MSWDYVNLADGQGLKTKEAYDFAEACREVDRGSLEGDPEAKEAFIELTEVYLKHPEFTAEISGRKLTSVGDVEKAVEDLRDDLMSVEDIEDTDELILEELSEINDRLSEIADLLKD